MATKKSNYDKVDSGPSKDDDSRGGCIGCLTSCPGKCMHVTYHKDEHGVGLCCLMSATLWCQMSIFLICLWILSGLFWLLMFYFTVTWPTKSLYAFLISCILFTALFGVLMALDKEEDEFPHEKMGCTPQELRAHIGPQLTGEMNWKNFGDTWHIVHKAPIYEENPNASQEERLQETCILLHYTNTIPCLTANLPQNRGSKIKASTYVKPSSEPPPPAFEEKQESTDVTIHQ